MSPRTRAVVILGAIVGALVVSAALIVAAAGEAHFQDEVPQTTKPRPTKPRPTTTTVDVYRNLRLSVEHWCLAHHRGHGTVDADGTARCER